MKIQAQFILLAFLLLFSGKTFAQDLEPSIGLDFDFLTEEQEYNLWMFNYNTYSDLLLSDFGERYDFDELNKFTAFLVFRNVNSESIANFYTENKHLQINADKIIGANEIPVEISFGESHIVMYKGANGKRLKEKIEEPKIVFESKKENNDNNEKLYLAELQVFDRILKKETIKAIESTLAIKYAIPLPVDSSYFDTNNRILFKNDDDLYYSNVRGIGRNDALNLNCAQVIGNREEKFVTLALGAVEDLQTQRINNYLDNNEYLFWTDNAGELSFLESENRFSRVWKLTPSNFNFDFRNIELNIHGLDTDFDRYEYFIVTYADGDLDEELEKYSLTENESKFVSYLNGMKGELPIYFSLTRELKDDRNVPKPSLKFTSPVLKSQNINILVDYAKGHDITIYGVNGEVVFFDVVKNSIDNVSNVRFDNPGIYFISIKNGNEVWTKRIIVQ